MHAMLIHTKAHADERASEGGQDDSGAAATLVAAWLSRQSNHHPSGRGLGIDMLDCLNAGQGRPVRYSHASFMAARGTGSNRSYTPRIRQPLTAFRLERIRRRSRGRAGTEPCGLDHRHGVPLVRVSVS